MKLGRLLLRGLKRRPPIRRRPARRARPKLALRATQGSGAGALAEPAAVVAARLPAPAPVPAPASAPLSAPATPATRGLAIGELLRPGDALRGALEAFLLDQRSEHTRRAYGKDLKRFLRHLATRPDRGARIDRTVVIAYKDSLLAEGLEHTTVDRRLASLRSFFRWLVDDGLIDRSPVEGVRFMNPRRLSRTIGFSDEEVRKILALPNLHTRTGAQHYAILMVLFHCGLRRSEVCALRTSSLGEERGHHVLRLRGKGNTERVVVLIPAAWNALRHLLLITRREPARDQWLFAPIRNNRTGNVAKALDPSSIFYLVTKYAREAGVANRVSPHSCRATAISNARDHHVPDRAIQEFAGWASPDMITRYDKRRSAVEKSAALAIRYAEDADGGGPGEGRPIPVAPEPG